MKWNFNTNVPVAIFFQVYFNLDYFHCLIASCRILRQLRVQPQHFSQYSLPWRFGNVDSLLAMAALTISGAVFYTKFIFLQPFDPPHNLSFRVLEIDQPLT